MCELEPEVVTYFTPQKANEILPKVKSLMNEIIGKKTDADALKDALEEIVKRGMQTGEYFDSRSKLDVATQELEESVKKLEALGCQLKDIDQGLVDFPAIRMGQQVNLCWKVGESVVEYWHGIHDGFVGRKLVQADEFYDESTTYHAAI